MPADCGCIRRGDPATSVGTVEPSRASPTTSDTLRSWPGDGARAEECEGSAHSSSVRLVAGCAARDVEHDPSAMRLPRPPAPAPAVVPALAPSGGARLCRPAPLDRPSTLRRRIRTMVASASPAWAAATASGWHLGRVPVEPMLLARLRAAEPGVEGPAEGSSARPKGAAGASATGGGCLPAVLAGEAGRLDAEEREVGGSFQDGSAVLVHRERRGPWASPATVDPVCDGPSTGPPEGCLDGVEEWSPGRDTAAASSCCIDRLARGRGGCGEGPIGLYPGDLSDFDAEESRRADAAPADTGGVDRGPGPAWRGVPVAIPAAAAVALAGAVPAEPGIARAVDIPRCRLALSSGQEDADPTLTAPAAPAAPSLGLHPAAQPSTTGMRSRIRESTTGCVAAYACHCLWANRASGNANGAPASEPKFTRTGAGPSMPTTGCQRLAASTASKAYPTMRPLRVKKIRAADESNPRLSEGRQGRVSSPHPTTSPGPKAGPKEEPCPDEWKTKPSSECQP